MCPSKSKCQLAWCKLHQQPLSLIDAWVVGTLQKCLPFFLKACFGILEVTVKGGQEQIRCFCQTFALRLKFNGETKVMHVHVLQVRNHNNILYFNTLYFPQICHFDRFYSKRRKGWQKKYQIDDLCQQSSDHVNTNQNRCLAWANLYLPVSLLFVKYLA